MSVTQGFSSLTADDPARIGGFQLLGRLGQGGMGRVYLGISPGGRAVAVKVIHPELARDPEFRGRFRREVAAARRVNGTYTAPVVAAGPDDELPWLATAYVAGPSLAAAVAERGPLPLDALWRLAGGLAEALADIHAGGLVHRDLKPGNVLLAADGPRVIDFGISRALDGTAVTAAGTVLGTPAFMSPEQVEGRPAGQATDVFALGSVLAFAATGRLPFGDGPFAAVAYKIVHDSPDLAAVPGELRALISACLAKDPGERPDMAGVMRMISARGATEGQRVPAGAFWPPELGALVSSYQARLAQAQPPAPGQMPEPGQPAQELASGREQVPAGVTGPSAAAGITAGHGPRRGMLTGLGVGIIATIAAVAVAIGGYAAVSAGGGTRGATSTGSAGTPTARGLVTRPAPVSTATTPPVVSSTPATRPATSPPATSPPAIAAPPTGSPPVTGQPAPLPVPTLLGAPDFNGYCQATGQGPVHLVSTWYAYGWWCTKPTSTGDDAGAVCSWTFRLPLDEVTNTLTNFYDPGTWQCWRAHRQLAAPDWNGYCAAQGWGQAQLTQQTAYGWHCSGNGAGLDDNTVCEWTNHASSLVLGRFQNFSDPRSWQCWI
jgi:hypothetical protein